MSLCELENSPNAPEFSRVTEIIPANSSLSCTECATGEWDRDKWVLLNLQHTSQALWPPPIPGPPQSRQSPPTLGQARNLWCLTERSFLIAGMSHHLHVYLPRGHASADRSVTIPPGKGRYWWLQPPVKPSSLPSNCWLNPSCTLPGSRVGSYGDLMFPQ